MVKSTKITKKDDSVTALTVDLKAIEEPFSGPSGPTENVITINLDADGKPVKPIKAKRAKKVKDPNKPKRKPSAYNMFVSLKMKTDEVKNLPSKERFKECGRLWSLEKAKVNKTVAPSGPSEENE